MTTYRLTYFNERGRAELIRYIFAVAGQKYEDQRLDKAAWEALKPKTQFGQLPILRVGDDLELCQSNSIARYLARQFGLAGKTLEEEAKADMIVDCVEDIIHPLIPVFSEKDDNRKAELKKKYLENLPDFYGKLETLLKANNQGKEEGFFVGSTLTWADLAVCRVLDFSGPALGATCTLDAFPALKAFKERVESTTKLAEWITARPLTHV